MSPYWEYMTTTAVALVLVWCLVALFVFRLPKR